MRPPRSTYRNLIPEREFVMLFLSIRASLYPTPRLVATARYSSACPGSDPQKMVVQLEQDLHFRARNYRFTLS